MQVHEPRVSVGMPVYNAERYLCDAIDSVLAQTYADFELIISDNGSTDGTEDICRSYEARDKRVRYISSATNRGISWNFNRVVHLAAGEYFRWQCYDDMCRPQLLERCVEVLDCRPDVVLAFGQTLLRDEGGADTPYDEGLSLTSPSPYIRFKQFLWHYRYGALCNVLYGLMRTSVLRQTRLIARFVDSDVVLIGDLALRGAFHEIPEPLFVRRIHAGITTGLTRIIAAVAWPWIPAWTGPALHP